MLINLNKKDRQLVDKLLERKELNIASSNALFEFSFSSLKPNEILSFLELDLSNEEEKSFYEDYFSNSIKELNEDDFLNNPYVKLTSSLNIKEGQYSLSFIKIKPYQTLPYDDISVDEDNDFIEYSHIGYFSKPFSYLALCHKDIVWMSTDPSEIVTMKPYINSAHGNLLVMGLGLGYFPYMASLNDNVKSITIIEKDKKVIDIFKKYILPKLSINKPFKTINDDAFSYIKNNDMNKYDYIFMDIWHNAEDGLPLYLRFKSLLKDYRGDTSYWLEESLIAMYRRCLLTLVEENLHGYNDNNYLKAENQYDHLINELYFKYKNTQINSFIDLHNLLTKQSIVNILK